MALPHTRHRHRTRLACARQRGVAFLIVLWVIALVSVLMGSFAVIARTENLQARHLIDSTRARYAAEAGVHLAAYALRRRDPMKKWVPDGRPYHFTFNGAELTIKVFAESGKININRADASELTRLFQFTGGLDVQAAQTLAARVQDWRDADQMVSVNGAELPDYEQAGRNYGPPDAPFATVGELQQVLGMDYQLFRKVEPGITVYSNSSQLDAMYAPREALLALPGMTGDIADNLIDMRHQIPPGTSGGVTGLMLPDGRPMMASSGGVTYSIQSTARLPNGAQSALEVTFRLGGSNTGARPFVIMRWHEGERS